LYVTTIDVAVAKADTILGAAAADTERVCVAAKTGPVAYTAVVVRGVTGEV
jgi:hypothetical protein